METIVIAIDGPSGAGKTTTANEVAKRLNFSYYSSGNIYRAICYLAISSKIDIHNEDAIIGLFKNTDLILNNSSVSFCNKDITNHLREPDVSLNVSAISAFPNVREYVKKLLHSQVKGKGIVVEGRDIGSVVFPEAIFKFFLDADPSIRKKRRAGEEIEERDKKDLTREIAPLLIPKDSLIIRTDMAPPFKIAERIIEKIRFCKRKNYLYGFLRRILFIFFKLYFRLSVEGAHNIPIYGPFIIASNHASYLDPPLIGCALKRDLHFFAKKELFFPILASLIRNLNAIPVDRKGSNKETIKNIVRILENGGAILIFPEGTRKRKDEEEKRPEKGIGYLAYLSNKTIRTPIVPVKIIGADKALGRGEFFIKPKKIKIIIGRPIFPEGLNLKDYQKTADIVIERIRGL